MHSHTAGGTFVAGPLAAVQIVRAATSGIRVFILIQRRSFVATRERILETALRLFNDSGTAAVSTNHIADGLGISPGNLYYHFRHKEEIIRAIFERLFETWDALFVAPTNGPPNLVDLQRLVHANFVMMWDYRFVYRELIALLRRDPELHRRYLAVRERGFSGFQQLFAEFETAGVLVSTEDPAAVNNLVELCWLISEFWLPTAELSGQPVGPDQLHHGVAFLMQVLRPFIASGARPTIGGDSIE